MSDSERTLSARVRAHKSWANTADPAARTAPARAGLDAKFERQVDPDGTLAPAERDRRAESARKAHFTELALKSVQARRRAADARRAIPVLERQAVEAEAELAAGGGAA